MEALRERLADVVVTTVTPFRDDRSVDLDAVAEQATFLAERGIRVLVPAGNTGEFSSLDPAESRAVVERVVTAASGACAVVAGVGGPSPVAAELARHAADAGADAVMIHHPTHTYIHPEGLADYYERIIEAADVGVILYKRGPELEDRLIADLVTHERVVAVKYAENDLNAFANLVSRTPAPVTWLCGTAERWAPFFALAGARGFSSGLANVRPDLPLALRDRLDASDYQGAMRLREEALDFEELRQLHRSGNNVPVVKEAMRLVGRDTGIVRDPLRALSPADHAELRKIVESWGMELAA